VRKQQERNFPAHREKKKKPMMKQLPLVKTVAEN
jgi:hypothetical protein